MTRQSVFERRLAQRQQRSLRDQSDIPLSPAEVLAPVAETAATEGALNMAKNPEFVKRLADIVSQNKFKLAGAGGLLALLAGAAELADQNDPLTKNIAEALGVTGGNIGGGLAGAAAGTAMGGPIGGVIGGVLGATGGGAAGKGIMGGLYGLVTNEDPQDKELNRLARQERLQQQLKLEAMKNAIPVQQELMRLKQADDFERMKMQLAVNQQYNFSNTMNTAALNAQQDAATQQALMTQYLYS